jgi:hypothetical protein
VSVKGWVVMSGETYLAADHAADKLLGGAGRLVPRAGGAVGVVLGHAAGGDGCAGDFGGRVRGVVLGVGLLLLGLTLGLVE